jgi:hypothetical protein
LFSHTSFIQLGRSGWPAPFVSPAIAILRLVPTQSHGNFTRRILDRSTDPRPAFIAFKLSRLAGDIDRPDRCIRRIENGRRN